MLEGSKELASASSRSEATEESSESRLQASSTEDEDSESTDLGLIEIAPNETDLGLDPEDEEEVFGDFRRLSETFARITALDEGSSSSLAESAKLSRLFPNENGSGPSTSERTVESSSEEGLRMLR